MLSEKELDMGDIPVDQQSDDESFTKISKDKPVTVRGSDKDVKKSAPEGYPRQVDESTSKIDNDSFGREFDMGEMSVDQTPVNEGSTKIGKDKSATVPGKEVVKKPASEEGSPRKVKEISGKIDKDAFGEEFNIGEMSVDQQSDDESFTKIRDDKPATVLGRDEDVKKLTSEGYPRQVDEIPSKMIKDAFGTEFDMGEMTVDQRPGNESRTNIAEDKPGTVPVKEKDLKKRTSEGSPREVELIPGKMDKDAFGKELDMGDISIDQQSDDESFPKIAEEKPFAVF